MFKIPVSRGLTQKSRLMGVTLMKNAPRLSWLAFQGLKTCRNIQHSSSVLVSTNLNRHTLYTRSYSTDQTKPDEVPESAFLEVLESTSNSPLLRTLEQDHGERLRSAYAIIFQIVMYIARPKESPEAGQQYLVAFESAPVSSESDMHRARVAVAKLLRAVVHNLSSIPTNSPLRTEKPDIFNVFGALQALHDVYLVSADGEVDEWRDFWNKTQPVMLRLGELLALSQEGDSK